MTDHYFYAVAQSAESNGGVYRFAIDEFGSPRQIGFTPLAGCNYLAYSPDRRYLYASCNSKDGGSVAALKVQPDGSLAVLNTMSSQGRAACYVTTSPDGKFLYCANYSSGSFAEFKLADDGSIAAFGKLVEHHGTGPNKARQECAHVHFTNLTPDGKYLAVVDLGIDAVKLYRLTPSGVEAKAHSSCEIMPRGEGPRHLVFNAAGDTAYLMNELASTVSRLSYRDGELTLQETLSALPAGFKGITKASAIRLSADGRWVLASNRGCDSIAVYQVLADRKLRLTGIYPVWGESPRDFNFVGDGSYLAIHNENSDQMVIAPFNRTSGEIGMAIHFVELPHPLCVLPEAN